MSTKEYYLYPGNLFASGEPYMVSTVLGSCISVCLYDPIRKVGGINHYMLPFWNGEGLASPKFGNIAIPKLIEKMYALGCRKQDLVAKVFGGGEVLKITTGSMNVGQRNITLAMEAIGQERIPIHVANVGGPHGRKIIFNTESGQVLMKKLRRIDASEHVASDS